MRSVSIALPLSALLLSGPAFAEGDLSRDNPIEIVLEMGTTEDGEKMYFRPDHLDLETGQAYILLLRNLDEDQKHEFAGHELIEKVFTRKVEITEESGDLVAEIKGNISEIEVGPRQEVEWFFVPVQTGEDLEMACELEGHREAGMIGTVTIR